jgi:hypothetical protein
MVPAVAKSIDLRTSEGATFALAWRRLDLYRSHTAVLRVQSPAIALVHIFHKESDIPALLAEEFE